MSPIPSVLADHELPSEGALILIRAICALGMTLVVARGWWVGRSSERVNDRSHRG